MKKSDIMILDKIKKLNAVNSLKSVPISTLVKHINLSHTKIRNSIKTLIENGLVEEGYMQEKAKTYYITTEGIELIKNLHMDLKNQEVM